METSRGRNTNAQKIEGKQNAGVSYMPSYPTSLVAAFSSPIANGCCHTNGNGKSSKLNGTEAEYPRSTKKIRVCIGGAAGFIGSHMALRLRKEGIYFVVGADCKKNEYLQDFCDEFHLVDLRNMSDCFITIR
jgi:hypothetical protein